MVEPLMKELAVDFAGKKLLSDDIPRIPYTEAMERYGSDKPDLRYGMELTDLTDIFANTEFGVFKNAVASGGAVKAICVKGGASLSRSQIDSFTEIAKNHATGTDDVLNGIAFKGENMLITGKNWDKIYEVKIK